MTLYELTEIEKKYSIESIKLNGECIWPVIRLHLNEALRSKLNTRSRSVELNKKTIHIILKSVFYNISSILSFKGKDFWVFSASDRRKRINGKFNDRVVEDIFSILPNSISIENPFPLGNHYPVNEIPNKNILSLSIFFVGSMIFSLTNFGRFKIQNEKILEDILKEYKVEVDYHSILKKFVGQYRFMRALLFLFKPKMVFMVYTGSSMGFIKAFKERNIPVIELQHGIINKKHFAYNIHKDFGTSFFPNYLLTYGEKELKVFNSDNFFIKSQNVFPVGYSFLQKNVESVSHFIDKEKELRMKYKFIVVFSFQEPFEKDIFSFLIKAAASDKNIIYLIIPRNANHVFDYELPDNLMIEKEANIYDALKICDFHATVNSTCVLEAFSFGKPSLLIDINGWAKSYYFEEMADLESVAFLATPESMVTVIYNNSFPQKDQIVQEGIQFFKMNFKKNFIEAMASINMGLDNA